MEKLNMERQFQQISMEVKRRLHVRCFFRQIQYGRVAHSQFSATTSSRSGVNQCRRGCLGGGRSPPLQHSFAVIISARSVVHSQFSATTSSRSGVDKCRRGCLGPTFQHSFAVIISARSVGRFRGASQQYFRIFRRSWVVWGAKPPMDIHRGPRHIQFPCGCSMQYTVVYGVLRQGSTEF